MDLTKKKRCIFNLDLNVANVEAVLTENGRLFHSVGPVFAKALSLLRSRRDRGIRRRWPSWDLSDLAGL